MGLKDALGRAVKGILDATDNEGDYRGIKWRENHPHQVIGGPNWYGGKDMGGGHLPKDAIEADRALARDIKDANGMDLEGSKGWYESEKDIYGQG